MKISKYINNISSLQFFQLFRFTILLFISIIFSKSGLSTGEIGMYETFLLIAGGVSFFWISGFIQSLLPLYKEKEKQSAGKNAVLFSCFILLLIFSILAGLFVVLNNHFIASFLGLRTEQLPYLKIMVAYIIFSGPNNLIEYILLLKNQSKTIIFYGIISLGLQLIFVTTPVLLGYDLGYGLYGLLAVNMLRFLYLLILLRKYSLIKISGIYLKEHLSFGAPLILSILLSGSASYVDGFLVSNKFDEATFAIFRYGAKELPFVVLMANAFSNAMIPEFSPGNTIKDALENIRRKSRKLINILFPASIILLLISYWIYPIIFNPDFSESATIFNLYLLIVISRMIFPQTILVGQKRTKIVMVSSAIELIINVGLSILLIGIWGIEGVALATLIAYLVQKIIMIVYLKNKMNIPFPAYAPVKIWALWSVACTVTYILVRFVLF